MSYLSNHFWGNFSEVGGFPKTLHNFLGWSDENLILPYKGRYIQLTEYEVGRFAMYEVKPGILRKAFWVFKLKLLL